MTIPNMNYRVTLPLLNILTVSIIPVYVLKCIEFHHTNVVQEQRRPNKCTKCNETH